MNEPTPPNMVVAYELLAFLLALPGAFLLGLGIFGSLHHAFYLLILTGGVELLVGAAMLLGRAVTVLEDQ